MAGRTSTGWWSLCLSLLALFSTCSLLVFASPDLPIPSCTYPSPSCYSTALAYLLPERPRLALTPTSLHYVRGNCSAFGTPVYYMCLRNIQVANDCIATPLLNPNSVSARTFIDRVTLVAGAYLVDGDLDKAYYAANDLMYIASLGPTDWNPTGNVDPGYLAVNQYLLACSFGYDWLYTRLTASQRQRMWDAVRINAFEPLLANPDAVPTLVALKTNVGINSLAGFVTAAIAFADANATLCQQVLTAVLPGIQNAIGLYYPSGAVYEGPTYQSYQGMSLAFALSALETGLRGVDFGFGNNAALRSSAYARIHAVSPMSSAVFSYADSQDSLLSAQLSLYMARRFKDQFLATWEMNFRQTGGWFRVFWADPVTFNGDWPTTAPALPSDARFQGYRADLVYMRHRWNDVNASYIACKAGQNSDGAGHSHLDLGSFVYDAMNVRWFVDLGTDDYGLFGYFNPRYRFNYYRTRTEGHNTLSISDTRQVAISANSQCLNSMASFRPMYSSPTRSHAVVDLTNAYPGSISVLRGFALLKDVPGSNNARLLIQDSVQFPYPVDVVSMFHTFGTVRISASRRYVNIYQNGRRLQGAILLPKYTGYFEAWTSNPAAGISNSTSANENANIGVTNLVVRTFNLVSSVNIAVLWAADLYAVPFPPLVPLDKWQ